MPAGPRSNVVLAFLRRTVNKEATQILEGREGMDLSLRGGGLRALQGRRRVAGLRRVCGSPVLGRYPGEPWTTGMRF